LTKLPRPSWGTPQENSGTVGTKFPGVSRKGGLGAGSGKRAGGGAGFT